MPENGPKTAKFVSKGSSMSVETKTAVTVAEMARMTGLSRARFYQLLGTAFPLPVYSVSTRRPFFNEEMQEVCLEVRRRNGGIDGKPILFYARRPLNAVTKARPPKLQTSKSSVPEDLIDGLRSLGLTVSRTQVEDAIKIVFPRGTIGTDQSEVVRGIFLHLKNKK